MQLSKYFGQELGPINDEISRYFDASLSENTKKSFVWDLNHYKRWGGTLPATIRGLATYLSHYAVTLKASSLQKRLNSIRLWHRINRLPDPADCIEIKQLMAGIKRVHLTKTKKANPLTFEQLVLIHDLLSKSDKLIDLRNLTLLMIGFFGAFRRSELIAIQFEELIFTDDGLSIFIPRSKTDQTGEGQNVAIPYGTDKICPIRTLKKWLMLAEIDAGPVFIQVRRGGNCQDEGIAAQNVSDILKELALMVGLDDFDGFSGHSLRRGFATTASRLGSSIPSIMRQGRWTNPSSVMGYIEEANQFTDNAAGKILMS